MSDLIDRQAAVCAIEEYADRLQMADWKANPGIPYKAHTLNWCINTLRDLPSIQPKRGKYRAVVCDGVELLACSECGYTGAFWTYNYCPNCGADMRGGEDAIHE